MGVAAEGAMLAEEEGGGAVGEESGENGRSGKRALERVVVERLVAVSVVGEEDEETEEVGRGSAGDEGFVGSEPEPERSEGEEDGREGEEGGKDG